MSGLIVVAPAWLGQSGLWLTDAKGKRKPVDAEDVGLSEALADRLEAWMDEFDAIYDEDNESASVFPDEVQRIKWEAEGVAITHAISVELGAKTLVQYDLSEWHKKIGR
jgi:hypothetical protein